MAKRFVFSISDEQHERLETYRAEHRLRSLGHAVRHMIDGTMGGKPTHKADAARMRAEYAFASRMLGRDVGEAYREITAKPEPAVPVLQRPKFNPQPKKGGK